MTTIAIILAAGRGERAGGDLPKQWHPLAGKTVLRHSVDAFLGAAGIDEVVVVLHPDDMKRTGGLPEGLRFVPGGQSRDASVRNALESLRSGEQARVLIHDAARPMIGQSLIQRLIRALETSTGAAPGLAVSDALWRGEDGRVIGSQPREGFWRAQTPQAFRLGPILAAHRAHPGAAADDVEVALAAGLDVRIVEGDEENFKITYPGDFARAEAILARRAAAPGTRPDQTTEAERQMDIRLGNGFDVHRFTEGDGVTLCGVTIPFDRRLEGHSDADVAMHALTDAIYGALAEGDIGRHFPPSDPQWKGAASEIFLAHAAGLVRERGFTLANCDVTIICERPKIGPHAGAMQAELARITGAGTDRISVKATTSERLGFTGREEGIAAIATATLLKP